MSAFFNSLIKRTGFYPGSLWAKRTARLIVMFAIGGNLFINDLQDYTLKHIDGGIDAIDMLTQRINSQELRLKKIDRKSYTGMGLQLASKQLDIPSPEEVNEAIEFSAVTLDTVHGISDEVKEISHGTKLAMYILKYTSLLIWIPIGLSFIWLLIDLQRGEARRFVFTGLVLAVPFNLWAYAWLTDYFGVVMF